MGDDDRKAALLLAAKRLTDWSHNKESHIEHLTFGCEFELVLSEYLPFTQRDTKKANFSDDNGKDKGKGKANIKTRVDHGKFIVRKALSTPLPVECTDPDCNTSHTFNLPWTNEESTEDYGNWQVTYDNSVRLFPTDLESLGEARSDYEFYAIEVRSRVLAFDA